MNNEIQKFWEDNKKAIIIVVIVVLAVLSSFAEAAESESIPAGDIPLEVVEWSQSNVWKVTGGRQGSGFWVDDKTMITNCHIVVDSEYLQAEDNFKKYVIYLKVKACDAHLDLAILEYEYDEPLNLKKTILLDGTPRQGKRLYGPGYPKAETLIITSGHWQGRDSYPTVGYWVTTPSVKGDSGSPVVLYKNGEVIVVGIRKGFFSFKSGYARIPIRHMTIVKSSETILKFLRENGR